MNKDKESLEELLKQLPAQIRTMEFTDAGESKLSKIYDLIILGYRNNVEYSVLKFNNKGIMQTEKLIEFYDGELKDNVKKMIEFLKETKFIEVK